MTRKLVRAVVVTSLLAATGCGHLVRVEPVQVQPIHVTVDVNIHDDGPAKPPAP